MKNLIQNSNWLQVSPEGAPMYFSGAGPATFDNAVINGARTCSITLLNNSNDTSFGADYYDPIINVKGESCINWGYTLRVIDADSIVLLVKFYDSSNDLIGIVKSNITDAVSTDFKRVSANFPIPNGAVGAKLSIEFSGKITACTYFMPMAFFC